MQVRILTSSAAHISIFNFFPADYTFCRPALHDTDRWFDRLKSDPRTDTSKLHVMLRRLIPWRVSSDLVVAIVLSNRRIPWWLLLLSLLIVIIHHRFLSNRQNSFNLLLTIAGVCGGIFISWCRFLLFIMIWSRTSSSQRRNISQESQLAFSIEK